MNRLTRCTRYPLRGQAISLTSQTHHRTLYNSAILWNDKKSNTEETREEFENEFQREPMKPKEKERIGWALGLGALSSYLFLGRVCC
jgi:hypothetical protein